MIINNYEINPTMAVFDGCHKIFIPVDGQERKFINRMKKKGWDYPSDFFKVEGAKDLMEIYIDSCPLRFIQQIDCNHKLDSDDSFIDIIQQGSFCDEEGFFDEEAAKAAFE